MCDSLGCVQLSLKSITVMTVFNLFDKYDSNHIPWQFVTLWMAMGLSCTIACFSFWLEYSLLKWWIWLGVAFAFLHAHPSYGFTLHFCSLHWSRHHTCTIQFTPWRCKILYSYSTVQYITLHYNTHPYIILYGLSALPQNICIVHSFKTFVYYITKLFKIVVCSV